MKKIQDFDEKQERATVAKLNNLLDRSSIYSEKLLERMENQRKEQAVKPVTKFKAKKCKQEKNTRKADTDILLDANSEVCTPSFNYFW